MRAIGVLILVLALAVGVGVGYRLRGESGPSSSAKGSTGAWVSPMADEFVEYEEAIMSLAQRYEGPGRFFRHTQGMDVPDAMKPAHEHLLMGLASGAAAVRHGRYLMDHGDELRARYEDDELYAAAMMRKWDKVDLERRDSVDFIGDWWVGLHEESYRLGLGEPKIPYSDFLGTVED